MQVLSYVGAAAVADTASCCVRVPFEVIKQQMQAGMHTSVRQAVQSVLRTQVSIICFSAPQRVEQLLFGFSFSLAFVYFVSFIRVHEDYTLDLSLL